MNRKQKLTDEKLEDIITRAKEMAFIPIDIAALNLEPNFDAFLNEDFDVAMKVDMDAALSSPVPMTPGETSCGTRKITIRIPNRILNTFKAKAKRTGTCYQTLMIQALNTACSGLV